MANLPSSWRAYYLTAYNIVQAGLWTTLFFLTLRNLSDGPILIIARLEPFARWTQTFALVDVLHAAGRLIPSGTATTFTQVGTRVIQVWAIWFAFPDAILGDRSADGNAIHGWASPSSGGIAFVALLLAWSVADAIRYTYLVCKMHHIESEILTWTRYSMFFVLYPVGISAEWWLMYRSIEPSGQVTPWLRPVFYFLLALYVPGTWYMLSHMVKQRRKVLLGQDAKRA
ncbi:hypothetical protein NLU13_7169 [Sarocladium strictum]|uniref:Very-long-chain (3R)-3-hydroxyacyl-CoA dehydratase n=1 Tax=Sarocladium strictum TaxID=5046 RepID=A0AA39L4Y9_SARSR|nr:hypothetical protein NLU13_7169 [Sarocladium strictum]